MAAFLNNQAITSGNSITWNGGQETEDFRKNKEHSFAVSGAGSAVITVNLGEGNETVGTIANGFSDCFYYPAALSFEITASGGDISVTIASFED